MRIYTVLKMYMHFLFLSLFMVKYDTHTEKVYKTKYASERIITKQTHV